MEAGATCGDRDRALTLVRGGIKSISPIAIVWMLSLALQHQQHQQQDKRQPQRYHNHKHMSLSLYLYLSLSLYIYIYIYRALSLSLAQSLSLYPHSPPPNHPSLLSPLLPTTKPPPGSRLKAQCEGSPLLSREALTPNCIKADRGSSLRAFLPSTGPRHGTCAFSSACLHTKIGAVAGSSQNY